MEKKSFLSLLSQVAINFIYLMLNKMQLKDHEKAMQKALFLPDFHKKIKGYKYTKDPKTCHKNTMNQNDIVLALFFMF